ncbi:MAG: alkaline phosphatase family protein [Pirellulaceae bacterium]
MPAPVHNPDGSESLWCYTKPTNLYGELRDALGHFPLQHFWGPLANIKATDWICKSAALAAQKQKPRFSYLYLPHLDYAAQKDGPDSPAALQACADLDRVLGTLITDYQQALENVLWLVASEYTIVPVDHVLYPNRLLRDAGMLAIDVRDDGEHLDYAQSRAWALVDHQFSHIFVKDPNDIAAVAKLFQGQPGVDEVLAGDDRTQYGMDHERSGEVIVISTPNSWQAYYWWLDDALAAFLCANRRHSSQARLRSSRIAF